MVLTDLPEDAFGSILEQACDALDPSKLVAWSHVSRKARDLSSVLRQQLQADYAEATALARKLGFSSCKELRESEDLLLKGSALTEDDMELFGRLTQVLSNLKTVTLSPPAGGPDGPRKLLDGSGPRTLESLRSLLFFNVHPGLGGAEALCHALRGGSMAQLQTLTLHSAGITDDMLTLLAPTLRFRRNLEWLVLQGNPLADKGISALLAPQPPTGVRAGVDPALVTTIRYLNFSYTKMTGTSCAALGAALKSGALPSGVMLFLFGVPAGKQARLTLSRGHPNNVYHDDADYPGSSGSEGESGEETEVDE